MNNFDHENPEMGKKNTTKNIAEHWTKDEKTPNLITHELAVSEDCCP